MGHDPGREHRTRRAASGCRAGHYGSVRAGLPRGTGLGCERAELGQIALGAMLPQVDGQVSDPARLRLVMTQRAGSQRPADPLHDLGRGSFDERAYPHGPPPAVVHAVRGVGVDLRGRLPGAARTAARRSGR